MVFEEEKSGQKKKSNKVEDEGEKEDEKSEEEIDQIKPKQKLARKFVPYDEASTSENKSNSE